MTANGRDDYNGSYGDGTGRTLYGDGKGYVVYGTGAGQDTAAAVQLSVSAEQIAWERERGARRLLLVGTSLVST